MNKRQKLVQQQFLNNEEAVIKRLNQVYSKSYDDICKTVSELDESIAYLQEVYEGIEKDGLTGAALDYFSMRGQNPSPEQAQETVRSMIQSKVYQKNYQTALKKQVGGILDTMHENEFKTVSAYLNKCYEEAFIGTMFDLQGQGIPLCFPLDQEAMVRAVQLDSKISQGLYSRLGEDVSLLKKRITAEVSRGISNGMSYEKVAQQIGFKMLGTYDTPGGAYAKALRIARTEGHRIQCQSGMDACYKAKEKGANVVKQWDATLDSNTRESHSQVDGEIRELDEKFSNGLMFPGDPSGGPGEVVNCRCALLQRAKWGLDEAELQTLKDRAEYFGLDKSDSFEEYKKKYLKASKEVETNNVIATKTVDVGSEMQKFYDKRIEEDGLMHTTNAQGVKEINPNEFTFTPPSKMSDETNARLQEKYAELLRKYKTRNTSVSYKNANDMILPGVKGYTSSNQMVFQSHIEILNQTEEELAEELKKSIAKGFNIKGLKEEDYPLYYLTHEFGHSIMDVGINPKGWSLQLSPSYIKKIRKFDDEINTIFTEYKSKLRELTLEKSAARHEISGAFVEALENNDLDELARIQKELKVYDDAIESVRISEYASSSPEEFLAESFALCELSTETSPYAERVMNLIKEYFGW